ncbi:MAG: metallo-beta-lactamase family protein [Brevundimonas sp.]|jgi:metallo-beta-lactamase family protein|uniref:MBL fold metallo-hydrolase n=1 Tax=Brevundimonas sp. TaxID=1871086 RepID=UPI0039E63054
MSLSLTFHGAAGCVTGFCALLQTDHGRFLVDCGLFQGPKTLKALNHGDFPFEAGDIDGVFLTHAHIDHSGLLPKLVRAGYRGPIYATRPTRDLCAVMLEDAAGIQEGDVAHLNRRNERRGLPRVEPIYSTADVEPTLRLFETVKFSEEVEVVPGITARYWPAGHLLGAASVELVIEDEGKPVRLLFSGDLGSGHQPFLPAPDGPVGVDHLVMEATYGDRERVDLDLVERRAALAEELRLARAAGGPLLMPTFAVGRAQDLILDLLAVMEAEPELAGEIYLDSPLAIEATEVFLQRGWNIDASENPYLVLRHATRLHYLRRYQESDRLDRLRDWHVILAGSGMCDAGRIRKHLKRLLWRRETTLLITGFQAAGTLGRLLMASPSQVRIQGDDIRVHARIRTLDVYSGHADASALVAWFQARGPVTGKVFLAHGEPDAVAALSGHLVAAGVAAGVVIAPELDQTFALTRETATLVEGRAARMLPGAATRPDWYNARADLLSTMNESLQALADDEQRLAVIAAMKAALLTAPPAAPSGDRAHD